MFYKLFAIVAVAGGRQTCNYLRICPGQTRNDSLRRSRHCGPRVLKGFGADRGDGGPCARFCLARFDWLFALLTLRVSVSKAVVGWLGGGWGRARLVGGWSVAGCSVVDIRAWLWLPEVGDGWGCVGT